MTISWVKQAQKAALIETNIVDAADKIFLELQSLLVTEKIVRAALHPIQHAREDMFLVFFGHRYNHPEELKQYMHMWESIHGIEGKVKRYNFYMKTLKRIQIPLSKLYLGVFHFLPFDGLWKH